MFEENGGKVRLITATSKEIEVQLLLLSGLSTRYICESAYIRINRLAPSYHPGH